MTLGYLSIFLDISLTAVLLYMIYYHFKETYSATIMQGGAFIIIIYILARLTQMETIRWIAERFFSDLTVIMVILFQQEIRRFFSNLGRRYRRVAIKEDFIEEIAKTLKKLSKTKTGALIVIEGTIKLDEFVRESVIIDSNYNDALIQTIFHRGTELHDGAIIIRKHKIYAAHVFFPTTFFGQANGTRHVAGISITTDRDCIALIVSEETGVISYARDGILTSVPVSVLEEVLREVFA